MNCDFTKKRPFASRLAAYALTAGVCLAPQAGSAAVIYVNPPDINLTSEALYPLQIDPDATNDYDVSAFADVVPIGPGFVSAGVSVTGLSSNLVSQPLSAGTTIDSSLTFNPSQNVIKASSFIGAPWASSSVVLGLQFTIGANTHYGWLRAAGQAEIIGAPSSQARIFDWAYEDSPGTGLVAPAALADPYAVPEPSSLALLALGATGIAALKARRKRQQS
jgi:PEP-CTERM motif-containing protein